MKKVSIISSLLLFKLTMLLPLSAYAHHPNGSQTPDSFVDGLLSGFGHPIIGLDHLAFILVMAALSYVIKQRVLTPFTFVIGTLLGCILHLNGTNIIASETLIAISVLLLGTAFALNIKLRSAAAWIAIFAGSGVLHGYAYGESIVGAEMTALSAYLIGFTVIQLVICYLASFLYQSLIQVKSNLVTSNLPRLLGGFAVLTATFGLLALHA